MVDKAKNDKTKRRYKQIGCATRGGEASRATEDTAIAMAREHDAELIFLYVADASFAEGHSGKFAIEMVEAEVRNIGQLVLEQARLRAKERGVAARAEIREGHVVDEIQHFVEKHKGMDAMVVGHMSEELRQHLQPVLQQIAQHRLDVVIVKPD